MNISIIGTAGIPARYGGFETLAENLVRNKAEDVEYTVFCSAKMYQEMPNEHLKAKLRYININANGISSIFYDFISMFLSLRSEVMLILGVSGSFFLPLIRLIYGGRIITNIDGIEWKRKKWNKFIKHILRISEIAAVYFSDVLICDNKGISDYITETYKKNAILIEYGADHTSKKQINEQEYTFCQKPYAISVCRIEPENNIHIILDVFSRQTEIPLVIVGNWKSSKYGLSLFKKYIAFAHINLLDPIYESDKIDSLRSNALVYIHGHSAGGTNPSLVEAMFLGRPVFAFDCVYNRCTTENRCIYWSNDNELYKYILNCKEMNLNDIGTEMKKIADNRYIWNNIIPKYNKLFYKN